MVNLQSPTTIQNFISYFFLTPYFILQIANYLQNYLQAHFDKNHQTKKQYTEQQLITK